MLLSHYRYLDPVIKDSILNFIKVKSQDQMHEGIFKRPIIELDSNNFDRIVKDKSKHVMVLYYTTWCESCKVLLKTMVKVAKAFKVGLDRYLKLLSASSHMVRAVIFMYMYFYYI